MQNQVKPDFADFVANANDTDHRERPMIGAQDGHNSSYLTSSARGFIRLQFGLKKYFS